VRNVPDPPGICQRRNNCKTSFSHEFLNRIDEIILYRSLSRSDIRKVVEVRLREVQKRLDDNNRKIKLAVDGQAMDWLGSAGYSPSYGARPMARLIQTEILNPLSKLVLQNRVRDGEWGDCERDRGC